MLIQARAVQESTRTGTELDAFSGQSSFPFFGGRWHRAPFSSCVNCILCRWRMICFLSMMKWISRHVIDPFRLFTFDCRDAPLDYSLLLSIFVAVEVIFIVGNKVASIWKDRTIQNKCQQFAIVISFYLFRLRVLPIVIPLKAHGASLHLSATRHRLLLNSKV